MSFLLADSTGHAFLLRKIDAGFPAGWIFDVRLDFINTTLARPSQHLFPNPVRMKNATRIRRPLSPVLGFLLRAYSYLYDCILALFLLALSMVAILSESHNLNLGMLPWKGQELNY